MTLSAFDIAAILIVLTALLGYVNRRAFGLDPSIALTVMGALASLLLVGIDRLLPGHRFETIVTDFMMQIDFHATLMDGMLSFLLFAGALHVDWAQMRQGRWQILVLSTFGVLLSTVLVGYGFQLISGWLGFALPLAWCLVFGALISPTDPVAVMAVLKRSAVPPGLQAIVAGESLYNDGVGVVIFTILVATALDGDTVSWTNGLQLFAVEAGGGVLLGLASGWLAYRMIRSIDDYKVEVVISLALVMGGYTLARWLHVSGPVAMATAGLLIGNRGVADAMSDETQDYLLKFWSLIDDILNAVLFLLIGLEVVTLPNNPQLVLLGAAAVLLALLVRAISVIAPLTVMRSFRALGPLAPITLIWGGLRGGISVALALGLPNGDLRAVLLTVTYVVVLFSVVVQGGTIQRLIDWRNLRMTGS